MDKYESYGKLSLQDWMFVQGSKRMSLEMPLERAQYVSASVNFFLDTDQYMSAKDEPNSTTRHNHRVRSRRVHDRVPGHYLDRHHTILPDGRHRRC